MKYISHVPLIGGFALANMNITGIPPIAITSYSAFENNDRLLLNYLRKKNIQVPYFKLDTILDQLCGDDRNIDFVSAVPPCAGISNCSSLKKGVRAIASANDWMYKSADFVLGVVKPTIYVFENAPGLYTDAGAPVRERLIAAAEHYGYAGTFYKTDTLLHGIPQKRPRTYTIFHKGNYAPILENFNRQCSNVETYIKDIPEWATLQDVYMVSEPLITDYEITQFVTNKFGKNWREAFIEVKEHLTSYDFLIRKQLLFEYSDFVHTHPEQNRSSIKDVEHVIKKIAEGKNYRLSHRVLCVDKHHIYAVIGEMMMRNVHPTEPRRMNIREYMHLMGLPHDFELDGPRDYAKITQNVPVRTSEDITREVIEIIGGKRRFSNERFHYQDNTKDESIKCVSLF